MTTHEKDQLKEAKLNWRREMRAYFGPDWAKRNASRRNKEGMSLMNIPSQQ